MVRFLEKEEYALTRPLYHTCFAGDDEFEAAYYAEDGEVWKHRIAVKYADGKIVSMAHMVPRRAWYRKADGTTVPVPVSYLFAVATDPAYRHRGYMDEVLCFIFEELKKNGEPWCFLIAVNKEIYRHLAFVYDWTYHPEEAELLYAEEGLSDCSAKLLCAEAFQAPLRLSK